MSEIHSVVFIPPYPLKERYKFLKHHHLNPIKRVHIVKVDGKPTQYRYRIIHPDEFKSFSTKVIHTDIGRINLVIGYR